MESELSEGKRRLAAIMFTDMVGYTALGQKNEALSLALVEEQGKVIRPVLARHNGREVKTIGDAFLIEFPNAVDAVRCAYDIQRVIREFNLSLDSDKRIHLRIGLHLGEVVENQGDISGDAVNVASRIESLAEDGGVCITRQVYDHVRNKVGFGLSSIGLRDLKNVSVPLEVFKFVMPWAEPSTLGKLDKRRVAVLPLANMSPDPQDDYFADGMTEELITTLSGVQDLSIISRTSVMQYKKSPKTLREIAKELDAGVILEGSVRKSGETFRITIQMIDAQEDKHLWAERYDRKITDVLAVQDEISEKVAKSLESEFRASRLSIVQNPEAFTFCLKGRQLLSNPGYESLKQAVQYFELAVGKDPSFAPAYASLAEAYIYLAGTFIPDEEGVPKALENVNRALELDSALAEAHTSLGILSYQYTWDLNLCEREFKRAIELNPSYSTAHQWYGQYLAIKGRFAEAVEEATKAEELDPVSPFIKGFTAFVHLYCRMYEEAIRKAMEAIALAPNSDMDYWTLGMAYAKQGKLEESVRAFDKANELSGNQKWLISGLGWSLALVGRVQEARDIIERLKAQTAFHDWFGICVIHSALGETEDALDALKKAFDLKEPPVVFCFRLPLLDGLRTNPKFIEIYGSIGLTEN